MTKRPSAIGVAGNVLLLILLLIMLPVGYWYHKMAGELWANPETANVIPTEASAKIMAEFISDWFFMELASPPEPDEAKWTVFWTPDQPWQNDELSVAVVDTVNRILGSYGRVLLDPEDEMVVRPAAIDLNLSGLPYIFYFRAEGPRDKLRFNGTLLARDGYFSDFIPRNYDEFKHGHLRNFTLNKWLETGVVEVSFVPMDTTIAPIVLDAFNSPQIALAGPEKMEKYKTVSESIMGPAGRFQIAVFGPGGSMLAVFFSVIAWILFALWFAAFIATITMMSRIRKQARSIDAMLSGTET
ncbi:hypothetical protein KQI52_10960 [bacterium]|nr:hypothetical protein [bacterium]